MSDCWVMPLVGDGALFTREDAVAAAWAAVEPILKNPGCVRVYRRGSWGPQEADALAGAHGDWHNPRAAWGAELTDPDADGPVKMN